MTAKKSDSEKAYRAERQIWREPPEETEGLYPGLVVHDARVSGSITFGPTRLPVWAVVADLVDGGFDAAEHSYELSRYGWDKEQLSAFLYHLLDVRGELARLLLVLADAERAESRRGALGKPWWQVKSRRRQVTRQLELCLEVLRELEAADADDVAESG